MDSTCTMHMCAFGKLMGASEFEDILIESGLYASGSINKVMNGKHYNLAMHVHVHKLHV
jgi:hypothetical protein